MQDNIVLDNTMQDNSKQNNTISQDNLVQNNTIPDKICWSHLRRKKAQYNQYEYQKMFLHNMCVVNLGGHRHSARRV